jgi:fucose permease
MTSTLSDEPVRPPVRAAPSPGGRRFGPGLGLLVLVFVGFISLGLPDGLLGVAWPSVRHDFDLSLDALGALLIAAMVGYTLASLSSGWVVERIGVGRLLALSYLLTACGLFGYALAPAWIVMVGLGVVAGLGAGAIDAGLNAYVALQHSPRLLSWLHAFFGVGAASGPAIMLVVLGAGQSWRLGYAVVAAGQLALALCFLLTLRRWPASSAPERPAQRSLDVPRPPAKHLARPASTKTPMRLVVLCVLLFFVYTGLETAVGGWAYTLFVEGRGVAPQTAGLWISAYWGSLAAGRVLAGIVANRLSTTTLVRIGAAGMLVGAVLIWLDLGELSNLAGVVLMGLSAAPIFPALIAATPERVGRERAPRVIGFEVGAANLGIGGVPALAGVLAARLGLEVIPQMVVLGTVGMLVLHEAVVRSSRPT